MIPASGGEGAGIYPIERDLHDLHWTPKQTLLGYAREAWKAGRIGA